MARNKDKNFHRFALSEELLERERKREIRNKNKIDTHLLVK
jgi:hypothetical protein